MSYELKKPCENKERRDFIIVHNNQNGLRIDEGSDTFEQDGLILKGDFIFALEPNEIMADVEVEIDVPDEEEYPETLTKQLLDANGEVVLDENDEPVISTTEITKTRQLETTHKETVTVYKPIINPDYEQEQMDIIRPQKLKEASDKAKEKIDNGYIEFKDAKIETNAQTVGDLTATMLLMQAGGLDTYSWLSMDDIELELSINDIASIGSLIAQYKNDIWNTKYIDFVEQIKNAKTLEELQNIEIEY